MTMLAFVALFDGEDWCTLVHGETIGKAKAAFLRCHWDEGEWNDIRVRRTPGLDNKPITYENAKAAGFEYMDTDAGYDSEGYPILIEPEEFTNDCRCDICRGKVEV